VTRCCAANGSRQAAVEHGSFTSQRSLSRLQETAAAAAAASVSSLDWWLSTTQKALRLTVLRRQTLLLVARLLLLTQIDQLSFINGRIA